MEHVQQEDHREKREDVFRQDLMILEVRSLSDNGLHDSAIMLGSVLVSLFEEGFPRACARCTFANALRVDGQSKRAIHVYDEALHDLTSGGQNNNNHQDEEEILFSAVLGEQSNTRENEHSSTTPDEDDKKRRRTSSPSIEKPVSQLRSPRDRLVGQVKFRMAQCYVSSQQEEHAVCVLESIPTSQLPFAALALLARLKRRAGAASPKQTISLLKESLHCQQHHSFPPIEVVFSLVDMEVSADDILAQLDCCPSWLEQLIRARCFAASLQGNREACRLYSQLSKHVLPGNAHVLSQLAKLELAQGNREAALQLFQRGRAADPFCTEDADVYASLLRQQQDKTRLVQLTHELLLSSARPEPWVAASLLADAKQDKDKALAYACKATELDPTHVLALHTKGALLLGARRPMEALSCFARALQIRREFDGLRGLVECYLAMNKSLDAIAIAKQAVEFMPHESRAFVLLGRALASHHTTEKLAVDSLQRALKLETSSIAACTLLADIRLNQFKRGEIGQEQLADAAAMLTRFVTWRGALQVLTRDQLYCKIGNLYAFAGDRARALENFHDALSVNAQSAEAKEALEALTSMSGENVPSSQHQQQRRSSNSHRHISPSSVRRSPPVGGGAALRLSSASSPDLSAPGAQRRRAILPAAQAATTTARRA